MAEPLTIGQELGGFRVESRIGAGAMGYVYKAIQNSLQRPVALKVLAPAVVDRKPEIVERFQREARLVAQLTHPNVVQVLEARSHQGIFFIAMEFVEGCSLAELLRTEKRLPELQALKIAVQVAQGLGAAEKMRIVHRDVKPANILLNASGMAKLADFGLVKDADADVHLTRTGQILGTPAYMSPEQVEAKPADSRSDLYSLGATLFHMLAGRAPFLADSVTAMCWKHVSDPVPDPREDAPEVSDEAARIVMRMMAKKPSARFPSFEALLPELRRAAAAAESPPSRKPGAAARCAAPEAPRSRAERGLPGSRTERRTEKVPKPPGKPASGPGGVPVWIWAAGGAAVLAVLGVLVVALAAGSSGASPHPELRLDVKPEELARDLDRAYVDLRGPSNVRLRTGEPLRVPPGL
ncbi:MAG: serine/threonine protein kinase, partial [Planctomycetes bacterium]|nr:serine/threonine protein kinase [Planctomycetota bacterium]